MSFFPQLSLFKQKVLIYLVCPIVANHTCHSSAYIPTRFFSDHCWCFQRSAMTHRTPFWSVIRTNLESPIVHILLTLFFLITSCGAIASAILSLLHLITSSFSTVWSLCNHLQPDLDSTILNNFLSLADFATCSHKLRGKICSKTRD